MTLSEILTEALKGKKIIADVEYYDSLVCMTKYSKEELVTIDHVSITTDESYVYGIIADGENEGKECNFPIVEDSDLKFLTDFEVRLRNYKKA